MKVMHQLLQDAARAANAHNTCDSRVGRFVADGQTYNTPFDVQDVRLRRTWRGAWTRECPAPDDVAEAIDSAKRWGYRIVAMSTKESRPLLLAANRWFFRDRGIARELARWTRLTPRRPRYREDGLNDVMLVLTPLERWVFRSLIRPSIYAWARGLGGAELLARASAGATRGIGIMLLLIGPAGAESEIEAGRLLTRLWLEFLRYGIYVHPQNNVIDCVQRRASSRPGTR